MTRARTHLENSADKICQWIGYGRYWKEKSPALPAWATGRMQLVKVTRDGEEGGGVGLGEDQQLCFVYVTFERSSSPPSEDVV